MTTTADREHVPTDWNDGLGRAARQLADDDPTHDRAGQLVDVLLTDLDPVDAAEHLTEHLDGHLGLVLVEAVAVLGPVPGAYAFVGEIGATIVNEIRRHDGVKAALRELAIDWITREARGEQTEPDPFVAPVSTLTHRPVPSSESDEG